MGHPPLELKAKTVVVIRGTSGIGLVLSRGLAQAGANAVPTGRREAQVRAAVSAVEAREAGRSLTCDVTDNSNLENVLQLELASPLRQCCGFPHRSTATVITASFQLLSASHGRRVFRRMWAAGSIAGLRCIGSTPRISISWCPRKGQLEHANTV
jgi:NAD(P)-dependent dehydrogenase (short-subunit alcohol dehydrogenase family)